ncbi:hypothetical protein [Burkholderia pyrrocinia]|nr:hypothetical protein [Burkholderia pyrrocinia]
MTGTHRRTIRAPARFAATTPAAMRGLARSRYEIDVNPAGRVLFAVPAA